MNYYDKLNLTIKNAITDRNIEYQLQFFEEITKLAEIIVNNTPDLGRKDYTVEVPIDESVRLTTDFFKSIKKEYSEMFLNILREKNYDGKDEYSVKFQKGTLKNQSEVRENGNVNIDYFSTLEDAFTITHEITHKFSQPKNQNSIIKQFLGETSTISMELLLEDYLIKNSCYDENEISIYKNNRLVETVDDAGAILFERELLKLYQKSNGHLTQDILLDYLNSMNKNSKLYELFFERGVKYFDSIIRKGVLSFPQRQRYVIGTILASDFHSQIKENTKNIQKLSSLIDVLGHSDITSDNDLKTLEKIGVPIVKDGKIKITDETISKLTDCYEKEIISRKKYKEKKSKSI